MLLLLSAEPTFEGGAEAGVHASHVLQQHAVGGRDGDGHPHPGQHRCGLPRLGRRRSSSGGSRLRLVVLLGGVGRAPAACLCRTCAARLVVHGHRLRGRRAALLRLTAAVPGCSDRLPLLPLCHRVRLTLPDLVTRSLCGCNCGLLECVCQCMWREAARALGMCSALDATLLLLCGKVQGEGGERFRVSFGQRGTPTLASLASSSTRLGGSKRPFTRCPPCVANMAAGGHKGRGRPPFSTIFSLSVLSTTFKQPPSNSTMKTAILLLALVLGGMRESTHTCAAALLCSLPY